MATSINYGSKKKCPGCGEPLESAAIKCIACDYQFTDVESNKRLKEFQEGLIKYEGKEKNEFISSFEVPNTNQDFGNFVPMVYSILMTDLQNGADRERVGAMVSLYNRLMNQIRMTLDENDSIRIDAENKEKSLKNEMEKYGQLLKERDKQIVKLFKKQNKFKNKHPVLHRFFLIGGIAAALFISVPAFFLISEGSRSAGHKGISKTIEKENVDIPYQIQDYFEVVSDAEITTFDYNCDFKIEFEMKNIKPLPEDMNLSTFIYLNNESLFNQNFENQIRRIKNNSSKKIILEQTGNTSDAAWKFVENLEKTDSLLITIN